MIKIKSFVFSPFAENTYILYDETKEAVIIDPGCNTTEERETLKRFIETESLKIVKLLNTHCHIDHVLGNQFVKRTFDVKLFIHRLDLSNLESSKLISDVYGIKPFEESIPDEFIDEGDTVTFGNSSLDILFVPGHAPGHVAFVCHPQKFTVSGDVLFRQSIGRTDFPGCNHQDLIDSIKNKMFTLGDDYVVHCGHGPETTIGYEKKHNPFLN
jgi:glyoxylase-like metal-dependent hydrolase (beta-lactamase superfamily II)